MPNIFEPDFDEVREHGGFTCRRARVSRQAGAERLGASLWEVPAGQAAYPYHYHLAEEEILFVLDAGLSLRTPEGWREVEAGEVLMFPVGERGAHQVVNRTDQAVRFLAISPVGLPDIVVQPDADKVGAFERLPDGGGMREWYRRSDQAGYWDDVPPPEPGDA